MLEIAWDQVRTSPTRRALTMKESILLLEGGSLEDDDVMIAR